jgi:hypothetical protein
MPAGYVERARARIERVNANIDIAMLDSIFRRTAPKRGAVENYKEILLGSSGVIMFDEKNGSPERFAFKKWAHDANYRGSKQAVFSAIDFTSKNGFDPK